MNKEELNKLNHLSLVSNVCNELETHLGSEEKILAEFTIDLGRNSETVDELDKKLKAAGIASVDVKKIRDNGLCTVEGVAYISRKDLLQIKGISDAKVDKIVEAASNLFPLGFTSASQFHAQRQEIIQISSGSRELDKILEGGIETRSITELYASHGSRRWRGKGDVLTLLSGLISLISISIKLKSKADLSYSADFFFFFLFNLISFLRAVMNVDNNSV